MFQLYRADLRAPPLCRLYT